MDNSFSRRSLLGAGIPAAAFAAAGLGTLSALAQQADPELVGRLAGQAYQNGEYTLPPLPYAYEALEPHIDAKTMQLHHDKHHLAYVTGLNKTIKALAELRQQPEVDPARLYGLQRDLTFNGGGHVLHTLFWATMGPNAGGKPSGEIAQAISQNYGSFEQFQNYYGKVAAGVKGSGWAILAYEPVGDTLAVFQVNEHDVQMIAGSTPLLPLDVWEHAYYLKYQGARADYIKAWWNVVNWPAVNSIYTWIRSRYRQQ